MTSRLVDWLCRYQEFCVMGAGCTIGMLVLLRMEEVVLLEKP